METDRKLGPALASTFPNIEGTKVSWRKPDGSQDGKDGKTYISMAWTARNRPKDSTFGCCQWIRYVVIADNLADATKAALDGLYWGTQIASSSRSSKDLQVIHVDANGTLTSPRSVNYAVVKSVKDNPSVPNSTIALELWFGDNPFNSDLKVDKGDGTTQTLAQLEAVCGKVPCVVVPPPELKETA